MQKQSNRGLFKSLPGFDGNYKINGFGDVYSKKINNLKKIDVLKQKYILRYNGRTHEYTRSSLISMYYLLKEVEGENINV